ncbi:MAG: hypothetical protein RR557_08830 [Bacilli bacterium]
MSKAKEHPIEKSLKNLKHRNGLFFNDFWNIQLEKKPPIVNKAIDLILSNDELFKLNSTEKVKLINIDYMGHSFINDIFRLSFKALVSGRSLLRDIKNGQHTHANISAYNGCMNWAKAILLMCGIWITPKKVQNKFWIIDFYPSNEKKISSHFNIIDIGNNQIGHIEIWLILQRIFRTSKNSLWESDFKSFILELDANDIAFHRNLLQYHNDYWLYDLDLEDDAMEGDLISIIQCFKSEIYFTLDIKDDSPKNSMIIFYLLLARNFHIMLNKLKPSLINSYSNAISNLLEGFNKIDFFNQDNGFWLFQETDQNY